MEFKMRWFYPIINLVRLPYASEISFREREISKSFPLISRELPPTLPIMCEVHL